MKIALCPNAFRGSLTALQAAEAMAQGLRKSRLACDPLLMPLADGGNGTLDVWLYAVQGERIQIPVRGPLGETVLAEYGMAGKTALVEMAQASGVELLPLSDRNPLKTSTFGTGQLIMDAVQRGATEILVGVGGSATVDGGAGCLLALGAHLLDKNNHLIAGTGESLGQLASIDITPLREKLAGVKIRVLCDVDNPLIGPLGAATIFGPQKGADTWAVAQLEKNLVHFAKIARRDIGIEMGDVPRTGAAGGLSAGLNALAGAELVSGADVVIQACGYDKILTEQGVALVITGEGKLDDQTGGGKGPLGIAHAAARLRIPVIALAGSVTASVENLQAWGFAAAWSIVPRPCSLEEALKNGESWLIESATHLGNTLSIHLKI
ncbi:MAG: glycerate kinase [Chloroflexi bacterium]|nr:glycerate kinase [Chloroflexota bacterium]